MMYVSHPVAKAATPSDTVILPFARSKGENVGAAQHSGDNTSDLPYVSVSGPSICVVTVLASLDELTAYCCCWIVI